MAWWDQANVTCLGLVKRARRGVFCLVSFQGAQRHGGWMGDNHRNAQVWY